MKEKLEVGSVASLILKPAAEHGLVHAPEHLLLGVGEQVAARAVQIGLEILVDEKVSVYGAKSSEKGITRIQRRDQRSRVVAKHLRISNR